jgi:hypothetical protein
MEARERLARRQNHDDLTALEVRLHLDLGEVGHVGANPVQTFMPISVWAISRPRKRSVILTLLPSSKNDFIAFIFTS